jgi:peptidoglycan/xylan/chitin deacetylase (PgdA/CDA1 family)
VLLLVSSAFGLFPIGASATTLTPTAQVSFTFDDGLLSSRTLAADALKASGVVATNYIITSCVGKTITSNPACPANPADYMTWAQISELQNTYGWEIGSHTETHPLLASTDPDFQTNKLTIAQVTAELLNSLNMLKANGYTATDFATPYGDYDPSGNPVLAAIAKTYASHRGFGDVGYNVFPYNDYLLVDQQVLSTLTVAQAKAMIDTAIANKQWLIFTFHEIVAAGAATTDDEYDYNVADLAAIAAYTKATGIRVVNPKDALVTNSGNLFTNSSFDTPISTNTADKTVWSTDDAVNIKQNTANNGSYNGASIGPVNSISLTSNATKNIHLFSPAVAVTAKPYVIKTFINIGTIDATKGEVAFFVEEFDASGAALPTLQYKKAWSVFNAPNPLVRMHNFEYTPSATAASARLQIVLPVASGVNAYIDNVQMFAEDGSTTASAVVKAGDVNGDGFINSLDFSIMLTNWNRTGMLRLQGDVSGDGAVNSLDFSILLTNWGK